MIRDFVEHYLREEGYAPYVDEDGDLVFKVEGRTLIYFDNADDQGFFQLCMPAIFDVTDDKRETALKACNTVSRDMKVVKACLMGSNSVWLFFENLIAPTPDISKLMPRAIRLLVSSQQKFYGEMN